MIKLAPGSAEAAQARQQIQFAASAWPRLSAFPLVRLSRVEGLMNFDVQTERSTTRPT